MHCHKPYIQSVVALITVDVHNLDVTRHLAESGTVRPGDFAWAAVMRYEYDADTDGVVVRQVNAR